MDILNELFSALELTYVSTPQIGINSIIDITLVAFIIYKLLIWIKETRAWALLKGIVFILIISLFSYVFKLYTVSFIISNTLDVGIIAIIVIFTPEIRKALEELGTSKFNFIFSQQSTEQKIISAESVESILQACNMMAKAKTGAIIGIENKVPLKDLADTGIAIDSVITTQLLVNIFEDKTPLHDGAVIITDNRIVAASCILPLTEQEIGKELGTRHRAAVGMSENSDAYVLVVSEESGKISMALNGTLYKDVSNQEIRKMIRYTKTPKRRKIKIFKGRKS